MTVSDAIKRLEIRPELLGFGSSMRRYYDSSDAPEEVLNARVVVIEWDRRGSVTIWYEEGETW